MFTQERKDPKRRGASFSRSEVDVIVLALEELDIKHNTFVQVARNQALRKFRKMKASFLV